MRTLMARWLLGAGLGLVLALPCPARAQDPVQRLTQAQAVVSDADRFPETAAAESWSSQKPGAPMRTSRSASCRSLWS